MSMGIVAAVGTGLAGAYEGRKSRKDAWKNAATSRAQGAELRKIYGAAEEEYKTGGPEYFGGDTVAGMTQAQTQGLADMEAAGQMGQQYGGEIGAYGQSMMGAGQEGLDLTRQSANVDYQQIAGPGQFSQVQAPTGMERISAPTSGMQVNPGSSALSMDRVSQLYNNPMLQGQVQAATRDTQRNLLEQQLPGLRANAAATGNVGSSRSAVGQAVAERGAMDRMADTTAQVMGRAYEQGLNVAGREASQDASMNLTGQQSNQQGQQYLQGMGQQAQLANQGASQNLQGMQMNAAGQNLQGEIAGAGLAQNAASMNAQNAFRASDANRAAGAQMGNMAQAGVGNMQTGAGMTQDAAYNNYRAGALQQGQNQVQIDADIAKHNFMQNRQGNALDAWNNRVLGSGNQSNIQQPQSNLGGQLLNVAGQIGSQVMANKAYGNQPAQPMTVAPVPQASSIMPTMPSWYTQ